MSPKNAIIIILILAVIIVGVFTVLYLKQQAHIRVLKQQLNQAGLKVNQTGTSTVTKDELLKTLQKLDQANSKVNKPNDKMTEEQKRQQLLETLKKLNTVGK